MLGSHFAPPRRGYHHGALRESLVEAARQLVAEKGPGGFTLVDAARRCGVSPAAPYRHFRDLDALLDELARQGFAAFATRLRTAAGAAGRRDAVLPALGAAYLAFARDEPAYYSAMFESGLPIDPNPVLRAASERAFAVLRAASERLIAKLPADKRPPALMMALHIWALSHGIASLFGRGDAARRPLPMPPEDLMEAGVLVYLRGLGLPEPASGA
jgi:AcrR family transcriptional regulator